MIGVEARLEPPLPSRIAVGGGVALLLRGVYTSPTAPRSLAIELGDRVEAVRASLPPAFGDDGRFWAIVDVPAGSAGVVPLNLLVRQSDGGLARVSLESLELTHAPPPLAPVTAEPSDSIAVCLATWEPDPVLFHRQIESLRRQTHSRWTAVVSDDASSTIGRDVIRRVIGSDDRFTVRWNQERLGSYNNFERAILAAPNSVRAIAFCDQDDFWHPEKLERMESAFLANRRLGLVCSDARVVRPDGTVSSDTFWSSRRHLPGDLRSIAVANSVPGCLALWDSGLRDLILPFPPCFETLHHDGWVASVAAATGGVRRLAEPLVDHVQHGGNVLGHQGAVDRRIGRLGRRDLVAVFVRPARRRAIAALQIDAALRPEAIARTVRLRHGTSATSQRRAIEEAARDDDSLQRIGEQVLRAIEAQLRGGLPGTELAVGRGLLASRIAGSRLGRVLLG